MILDPTKPIRIRLFALAGVITTFLTIWVGLYPSPFTIVGILVLPAFLIFVAAVIGPSFVLRSRKRRIYLISCVVVSILCWAFEFAWLALSDGHWIPPWK